MSDHSSQQKQPTPSTTDVQTFLKTCVLDADHKALQEHLGTNPVEQSDLDNCLLRGLQIVQRKERDLSQVTQSLTVLLQSGAKWNNDALLDEQKTPYHIICDSAGDHHELLDLMIKSSQKMIIDAQDFNTKTALMYAVSHANINCIRCLIANGVDVNIGTKSCPEIVAGEIKSWAPIMKAIWMLSHASKYSCVILTDIFDLLLDAAVDQNKDDFMSCTDYIICAVIAGNVTCIKKLIQIEAPLNIITNKDRYVWTWLAQQGSVQLLKHMFNHGFDKNSIDENGFSVLWWVVVSGKIEAVRYLLDLGVAIHTISQKTREKQYEKCKENKLIMADHRKQDEQDPCLRAIRHNELEIVKLLDEYGSLSCKSFTALRYAVSWGHKDVVSYLLNKYSYPLNREYIIKDFGKRTYTLLKEPISHGYNNISLLQTHGPYTYKKKC